MAGKEDKLHPLEIQHNLVEEHQRDALASALLNATVQGPQGLVRVIMTMMAATAGGKLTHEAAEVMTKQAELLFTTLMAMQLQGMQAGGAKEDPLVAALTLAQEGAKKMRPDLLIDQNGAHELGLQTLDKNGNAVDVIRARVNSGDNRE